MRAADSSPGMAGVLRRVSVCDCAMPLASSLRLGAMPLARFTLTAGFNGSLCLDWGGGRAEAGRRNAVDW
jgi:hypothetical protein